MLEPTPQNPTSLGATRVEWPKTEPQPAMPDALLRWIGRGRRRAAPEPSTDDSPWLERVLRAGRPLCVIRSNGEREDGWICSDLQGREASMRLERDGLQKTVTLASLLLANPEVLRGQPLRVLRSSGDFETDWQAQHVLENGKVLVTKPGMMKQVPIEMLIAWNE